MKSPEIKGFPGRGPHLDEKKSGNRLTNADHIMVTIEEDFVTMVTE